jgi:hypothetical protein
VISNATPLFGNMLVLVTDGHLPYPSGHEITGYQVKDLAATLEKAKTAGVKILRRALQDERSDQRHCRMTGRYVAELHALLSASSASQGRNIGE